MDLCKECGGLIETRQGRWGYWWLCRPCVDAMRAAEAAPDIQVRKARASNVRRSVAENRLRAAAHRFVGVAIRNGFLDVLDGTQLCVDCGAVATDYEHRDYARPLDVEPVCRACNARRGMGAMPAQIAANDS